MAAESAPDRPNSPAVLANPDERQDKTFRKLAISFAAIAAVVGFMSVAAPAHADVNISQGTYEFSNFQQYLTNTHGIVVGSGDQSITFTNGAGFGGASEWTLTSHGHVTASGDTFTPGSGLNAAFNNYTIWKVENGDGPYAGGCTGSFGARMPELPAKQLLHYRLARR